MSIFSDPFINWRRVSFYGIIAIFVWALTVLTLIHENRPIHKRVVLIVVDGLRPDALEALGPKGAPNFHYLMQTGASTLNARSDPRDTRTLPNVASMLTGRPVFDGESAHRYRMDDYVGKAVHDIKREYVQSIFDVLYQSKLRSSFFASKRKMGLFVKSYTVMPRDRKGGKDPSRFQSYFITDENDALTLEKFLLDLREFDSRFIFLHLSGPDAVGHRQGWRVEANSPYMQEARKIDGYLGKILEVIRKNDRLNGQTYLIVTSDHGGDGRDHLDTFNKNNYTVPFFVWGPGVAKGADLYQLNHATRRYPKKYIIPYESNDQPIRNADAGNLALFLLELPPIPDSVINGLQSLRVK
ncbi:MAG TPA: alkaline phosphatase family protein [Candidatus Omnitrophota bacterium]|nr:alkaline phosphatase family protein [Candidatus Omnitrophota bacterium]